MCGKCIISVAYPQYFLSKDFIKSPPPPPSLPRCRRDWKFHEDEGSARRLPFANREPVSSATPSRIESNLSMARFPSRDTDSA